jgi:putative flippase GtrA
MILSKQFLVYISGGILCAALDIGIMQLLISSGVNYLFATSVGFFISFLVNYAYHAKLTFQSASSPSSFVKFCVVVALNYLITLACVYIAYTWFDALLAGRFCLYRLSQLTVFYWVNSGFSNEDIAAGGH